MGARGTSVDLRGAHEAGGVPRRGVPSWEAQDSRDVHSKSIRLLSFQK